MKKLIIAVIAAIAVWFFFFQKKDEPITEAQPQAGGAGSSVPNVGGINPMEYLDTEDATKFQELLGTTNWLAYQSNGSWHKQVADSTKNPADLWWNAWRAVVYAKTTGGQRSTLQDLPRVDVANAFSSLTKIKVA